MKLDLDTAREKFSALDKTAQQALQLLNGESANSVLVGTATCGRSAGALPVLEAFKEQFAASGIDGLVSEAGCMGHCYAEPMALLRRPGFPPLIYHHLNPIIAKNLVKNFFGGDDPMLDFLLGAAEANEMLPAMADFPRYGMEHRRLMKRSGLYDPENIFQAIGLGVYQGFRQALEMGPSKIVEKVTQSGLRGLGGAGFLTGKKFEICSQQPGPDRYIICNADEGDPGAFMDRCLLESDPHAVLEGMLIAALAVSARHGLIYVRAEYPLAVTRLQQAIDEARRVGLLGADILGSGFEFDIELVRGAGAFVCGEETALIESVEGRRGIPRPRPPFPVVSGLHGNPSLIDNVKTLASIAPILTAGAKDFASQGTSASKGTAVFALAGKIVNPGLVEVPMGTSLRQIIFDIGGGIPGGKKFKAVQIGGPSGGCLPEDMLDTPVDFDALKKAGAMMGSGGMVILDEDNCMVETARYFLEFTQHESCGKCTFCRVGTRHMLDILERIVQGDGRPKDLDRLEELAADIKDGSLCNLGKTAPNPVLTTLRFFKHEYEEHINDKRCRARVCNAFTSYYILPDKCARGCDACVGSCPTEAIFTSPKSRIKVIEQDLCTKCDSCMSACPKEYDAVVKISPVSDTPSSEPRPQKSEGGQ